VSINEHVHVNEQSLWSMQKTLRNAGFKGKVWLESPPQTWGRSPLDVMRRFVFATPPFRWFFQREVFAIAAKS
ncbi:MAG: hypothetical protein KC519_14355, partial [Anaerolineae bacterium]|nr:hypothetical protein [Anaerolineae bacterium]